MTNTITANQKKEVKHSSAKVCAILHSITAILWVITAGMVLYSSVTYGTALGWTFVSDLAIAVVFGSCAVSYYLKYRKEQNELEK